MLEPGTAKGGRTSTPFPGTYVLWLGDVVVGVVTAQRGLAGHRQLARWRWVVSKGHQVVVLLKASSCWGVAGFGGLLQVALLLDLSAHGGVPVVLDSIISSATEIQTFEEFRKWALPIQRQVNGQGTVVSISVKTLFSDLPPTLTTTNATPNFSEKMLGMKVREKEKQAMVVYILFKALSHPLFLSFSHLSPLTN